MNWEMVAGLLRHLLTFGGGYVVAKGWFDEATMNSVVAALITIVGAGWSVIAKRKP
jgi:hypothetical protein